MTHPRFILLTRRDLIPIILGDWLLASLTQCPWMRHGLHGYLGSLFQEIWLANLFIVSLCYVLSVSYTAAVPCFPTVNCDLCIRTTGSDVAVNASRIQLHSHFACNFCLLFCQFSVALKGGLEWQLYWVHYSIRILIHMLFKQAFNAK